MIILGNISLRYTSSGIYRNPLLTPGGEKISYTVDMYLEVRKRIAARKKAIEEPIRLFMKEKRNTLAVRSCMYGK